MVHVGQQDAGGPLDRERIDADAKGAPTVQVPARYPATQRVDPRDQIIRVGGRASSLPDTALLQRMRH